MKARQYDVFDQGTTCWRVRRAGRAKLLVDPAAYFGALRAALLRARQSIFIVGWDIDSRMVLRGEDEPCDGAPLRLREFLIHLVEHRPELTVHLLPWDYSVFFAMERELLPGLNLDWATPPRIRVCLDDVLPLGGAHHQKIVVVDDTVAFCGGIDLTIRRWDTPAHAAAAPQRLDPADEPYPPFHDMQMCVDGEAAAALGELARDRWARAAGERTPAAATNLDPWPEGVEPDFRDIDIAIARTAPAPGDGRGVREIEALYLAMVASAERFIYIENQFLTADRIAAALAERLRQRPRLEAVAIAPRSHDGWVEMNSMEVGRTRFLHRLRDAGVADRVRVLYPYVDDDGDELAVMVHAKLMVVDDRLLRVGSANLNNRSMGNDSECDLALRAASDSDVRRIAAIREGLMAEHLGVAPSEISARFAATGSLLATVDGFTGDAARSAARGLRPVATDTLTDNQLTASISEVIDPERPIAASRFIGGLFHGEPAGRSARRVGRLVLFGLFVLLLALLWNLASETGLTDVGTMAAWLEELDRSLWSGLLVPLLFLVLGFLFVPVTLLIAVTAIAFSTWTAFGYAAAGTLLSAVASYCLGAKVGRRFLSDRAGTRLDRINRALSRKGILSVAVTRLVPLAPFTLVNLVAGASHIRFTDFVLGTALGMAPGILIMTALGRQLAQTLIEPTAGEMAMLALIVVLWVGASLGLQALVLRLRDRQ